MDYKRTLTAVALGCIAALCLLEYVYIPLFGVKPGGAAIPFWQHPPRAILVHGLYLVSPALVKPANFLFGWCVGLGVWLGFRQILEKNVLDNPNRSTLFSYIRDHPGIHFRELERETGVNRGTLAYHLGTLVRSHKIIQAGDSGHTRYFENDGKYSELEQKILSSLNSEQKSTILRMLLGSPASRSEIGQSLSISAPSVAWHMSRLSRDGIVSVQNEGRQQKYRLNSGSVVFLQRYFSGKEI